MTTIHLETEAAHAAAQRLAQEGQALAAEIRTLRRALWELEEAWQGGGQAEFGAEAGELARALNAQTETLPELASRLGREIQEWESVDRRGASDWGAASGGSLLWDASLPFAAGGQAAGISLAALSVLPMTAAFSIGRFLSGIPAWLDGFFGRLFPPTKLISPLPEGWEPSPSKPPAKPPAEPASPRTASPSAAPSAPAESPSPSPPSPPASGYDLYYDVPVKSQGTLYGSAACTPTSISMVLGYFHHQNPQNQTVSPQHLIQIMDKGDGTPGRGISISNLTDELNDLGYHHITTQVHAGLPGLKDALGKGPVVVVAGVRITGGGAGRALNGPGSTMHAMVVRGISENHILVNDPWSGKALELPMQTFTQMWQRGLNSYYAIRP